MCFFRLFFVTIVSVACYYLWDAFTLLSPQKRGNIFSPALVCVYVCLSVLPSIDDKNACAEICTLSEYFPSSILLCPWEWWQCIVMSTSVCLSVNISLEPHMRSLSYFCACCLSRWLGPHQGWQNPKGKRQFWGFSSPLTIYCTA